MINIKHKIKVKNRKIEFSDKNLFMDDLVQYEDKEAYLIIKPFRKDRSGNQNRYYWGVVIKILADELGYDPDELHEVLKLKFIPPKVLTIKDEEFLIPDSSKELTTSEFEDYLSHIRTWASTELSCLIPLPNEVEY